MYLDFICTFCICTFIFYIFYYLSDCTLSSGGQYCNTPKNGTIDTLSGGHRCKTNKNATPHGGKNALEQAQQAAIAAVKNILRINND